MCRSVRQAAVGYCLVYRRVNWRINAGCKLIVLFKYFIVSISLMKKTTSDKDDGNSLYSVRDAPEQEPPETQEEEVDEQIMTNINMFREKTHSSKSSLCKWIEALLTLCLLGLVLYLYFQHSTHETILEQQIYTNDDKVSGPISSVIKPLSDTEKDIDGAETVPDDSVDSQNEPATR